MKIDTIEFTTEVVKERSITPTAESLGVCKNVMEFGKVDNIDNQYYIEWTSPDNDEVYAGIGIWTKGKKVIDYDGVFELPKEAIKLLNRNGFNTSEVSK